MSPLLSLEERFVKGARFKGRNYTPLHNLALDFLQGVDRSK